MSKFFRSKEEILNKNKPVRKAKNTFATNLFQNLFAKKTITTKKESTSSNFKKKPKNSNLENKEFKVFAPQKENLFREKIKSKILPQKPSNFSFGFKNYNEKKTFNLDFLQISELIKNFNFYLVKWRILERFNSLIAIFGVVIILLIFVYIAFFDIYFLVKNYQLNFEPGSYLSLEESQKITSSFAKQRFLNFIPNNQYWFVNEYSLTKAAKEVVPEVQFVKLEARKWPNTLILKIYTEPILATLAIKQNSNLQYYRVSKEGRIISEDKDGVWEKVIYVERQVSVAGNQNGLQTSLKYYNFANDISQLNRFWFVNWLWENLGDKIAILNTALPSLNDTDVVLTLTNGTKIYLDSDSSKISLQAQEQRLKVILSSEYLEQVKSGNLAYIDLRIPNKRIYLCSRGQACEKALSEI